jgi:primary-amine oxidase
LPEYSIFARFVAPPPATRHYLLSKAGLAWHVARMKRSSHRSSFHFTAIRSLLLALLLASRASSSAQTPADIEPLAFPVHPLDPLTANEINLVREIVLTQAGLDPTTTYWTQLREPPKADVLRFKSGMKLHRQADVVAVCPQRGNSFEFLVDLDARQVESTNALGNLQPALSGAEFYSAHQIIDNSPAVRVALEKRGYQINGNISDRFYLDLYAPGADPLLLKDGKTIRAVRVLFADRQGGTNSYGPYVEGLMALVDVFGQKLISVEDNPGAVASQVVPGDIFNQSVLGPKNPEAELQIGPPVASRLKLQGHHARWENWDFRFSFNQREGLVLHQIGFRDAGRLRSICYRAAISEMLVPYSDPSPAWIWREFFDAGEYGLGYVSTAANAGKELPVNALTLSVVLPDETLHMSDYFQNRIFFYERDGGALFAHSQGEHQARIYARARELVVGFIATVGNYDYVYTWIFREDGSFGFEAELQGLILDKTVADAQCQLCVAQGISGPGIYQATNDQEFGSLVSPQIDAVFHQHWINLRMDFDIDGTNNAVEERDIAALAQDPAANPRGRAFTVRRTVFAREREAERNCDSSSNRVWVVYNPEVKSALGHFSGYEIDPQGNTVSAIPESRFGQAASFTQRHFWATRYHPTELYAAGKYPNQAPIDSTDNLYHYANDNEDIYNQDVVLWYSLGLTHIPRPEDYPIMPPAHVAVNFTPCAFFTKSPALGYATIESKEPK